MHNEVVGIAGLLGSGRTELANLIFGIDTPDTGTLTINGKKVDALFAARIDQRRALPCARKTAKKKALSAI